MAREPKLVARSVILGEMLAGREIILKISLKNVGNSPTTASYGLELPDEFEGEEVKCDDLELDRGQNIEREYHLVPKRPGKYSIPAFDVFFKKSDGDETSVNVAPINVQIDGMPKIKTTLDLSASEYELGEEVIIKVTMVNEGTSFAKNLKLQVFTPPTVLTRETKSFLPTLGVDEKRTALIKVYPAFDGKHPVELKLNYQTPPNQKGSVSNEVLSVGSVTIEVNP